MEHPKLRKLGTVPLLPEESGAYVDPRLDVYVQEGDGEILLQGTYRNRAGRGPRPSLLASWVRLSPSSARALAALLTLPVQTP